MARVFYRWYRGRLLFLRRTAGLDGPPFFRLSGLFSSLPITKPLLALPYNAAVSGRIGLCDETDQTCDEVDQKQVALHFPEHFSKALD